MGNFSDSRTKLEQAKEEMKEVTGKYNTLIQNLDSDSLMMAHIIYEYRRYRTKQQSSAKKDEDVGDRTGEDANFCREIEKATRCGMQTRRFARIYCKCRGSCISSIKSD